MISNEKVQGLWCLRYSLCCHVRNKPWCMNHFTTRPTKTVCHLEKKTKKHRFITILLPFSFRRLRALPQLSVGSTKKNLSWNFWKGPLQTCLVVVFVVVVVLFFGLDWSYLKLQQEVVMKTVKIKCFDWLTDWLRSHPISSFDRVFKCPAAWRLP